VTAIIRIAALAALCALAPAGIVAPAGASAGCVAPANASTLRAELIAAVNVERQRHGLAPLRDDSALDRAAQNQACDNAALRSISHLAADGSPLQSRLRSVGYRYRLATENTGRGFATPQRAVEWWMNSPKHRANILMTRTRDIGVGIALSAPPDNRLHWIIVMAKSR